MALTDFFWPLFGFDQSADSQEKSQEDDQDENQEEKNDEDQDTGSDEEEIPEPTETVSSRKRPSKRTSSYQKNSAKRSKKDTQKQAGAKTTPNAPATELVEEEEEEEPRYTNFPQLENSSEEAAPESPKKQNGISGKRSLLNFSSMFPNGPSDFMAIIYEYERKGGAAGTRRRLQYLSFEEAAAVTCPGVDFSFYSRDWISRMRKQYISICTSYAKYYARGEFFIKKEYANTHRVTSASNMFTGVADKKRFIRPIAVLSAAISLVEANVTLVDKMEQLCGQLDDYNECCSVLITDKTSLLEE